MQQIESFSRWIYIFDDSETLTREHYICEILLIYLFTSGIPSINSKEAVEYLEREDNFGILFTVEEIEAALNSKVGVYFDCSTEGVYNISSNGWKLYTKRPKENGLHIHITRYVEHVKLGEGEDTKIGECLLRYIYEQFCTNVSAIARIITGQQIQIQQIGNYSPEEVEAVNDFLNWSDNEKNAYVAKLLARAYDFCVIASDCADKKTIDFDKCIFYLDTNVIFRLTGLNNEARRELSSSFIKKSIELKCKIKYTQFTKKELYKAIDRQIDYIKSICRDFSLIEPAEIEAYMPIGMSIDVYSVFYVWTKKGKLKNDYSAFKLYLYEKCEAVLDQFTIDEGNLSFFVDSQGFSVDSMYNNAKKTMPDKPNDSIKTDINNLLVVTNAKKQDIDTNVSFISTDHRLIKWAADAFGGQSPAELPSVWLSIMLRFGGRTSNHDYEAFCQFIKLPIGGTSGNLPEKLDLLACVQLATNDEDIKKRMLRELRINSENYKSINNAEKKIIAVGQTVLDSMYHQMHEEIQIQVEKQTDKKYSELLEEFEQESKKDKIDSIKALQIDFDKYKKKEEEKQKIDIKDSEKTTKLQTIKDIALGKTKRQFPTYCIAFIFIILIAIAALIIGIKLAINNAALPVTGIWVGLTGIIFSILIVVFDVIIYKKFFGELSKDKITCRNIFALGKSAGLNKKELNNFCRAEGYMI